MERETKNTNLPLPSSTRRKLIKVATGLAGFASLGIGNVASGQPAVGQTWPSRPVRVIVPFGSGGSTDILGRIIAQQLSKQLPQPFVVENKPGAGATIGAAEVARAPADGYTLLIVTPTFAITQFMYSKLPYDGQKDFVPVGLVMTTPLLLVVNPASGFKNVGDFVRAAKANPGKMSFASTGYGSVTHLGFELLMSQADIKMLHVPYKGGGEGVTALLGGTVDAIFSAPIEASPFLKPTRLVALGASTLKRTPGHPDIPTIAESGVPGYEVVHYTSVLVRKGTPPEIIAKLSDNIVRGLQDPDMREKIIQNGDVPLGTLTEASELFAKEHERWGRIVKEANIKPE